MRGIAEEGALVAAALPDASLEEALLVTRCRVAISKIDNHGPRGLERVTSSEIAAMAVMLVILCGPLFASAADHTPQGEAP